MASGSFTNNSNQNCGLTINWNSSKGTGGSTVNASLIAQNRNNWYFDAIVYGYGITINGSQHTGTGNKLSGATNGATTLISHSVWVAYTGSRSINISGYANLAGITNLTNQTIGPATVTLDNVGYVPTMGKVLTPKKGTIDETTKTIEVTWEKATSYDNSCYYSVGCSINGGAYTWDNLTSSNINTTSYTYKLNNPKQGNTYQFALSAKNNVGWSSYTYSEVVTINELSMPTIGDLPNPYNPYLNSTLTIPITGGGQSTGDNFYRCASLYYNDKCIWTKIPTQKNNTNVSINYGSYNYLKLLGAYKYTDTFTIRAWTQNDNGTKSQVTSKDFILNINSDGGAIPVVKQPTFSGGALGYPSTCFVVGVSTLYVSVPTVSQPRSTTDVSLSYRISCTGANTTYGSSASFSGLSSGVKTVTVTVTDSRGLSATSSKQCIFQSYTSPTVKSYSANRLDNVQTSIKLTYDLTYTEIYAYNQGVAKPGNQLNTINSQEYSVDGTNWIACTSGTVIKGMSAEKIYNFDLRITDKVRPSYYIKKDQKIPTMKTNLAIRKWGIGLNCVPQSDYALEVRGNTRITDDLTVAQSVSVGTSLSVTQSAIINDNLSVKGNSIISGVLTSNGKFKAINNASFNKDVTITGTLNSNGNSVVKGSLTVDGDVLVPELLKKIYPIGAVYITYNNVNPSTFLGGTWERFGQGRTLVGEGTGNDGSTSMSFTANSSDGKYKNTHYHVTSFGWDMNAFYAGRPDGAKNNDYNRASVIPNGYVINAGSSQTSQSRLNWTDDRTISNVQPYITVFFWRRTA